MSTATHVHTLREYIDQAMPILMEIPGFSALTAAAEQDYDAAAAAYPDATFTMMVMNNLFHHDWEFAAIHQQAFSSIIGGADIPSVRKHYDLCMDAYWQKHLWDD